MKLFLDRHKTLLPRLDIIYLLTRFMTLCSIVWYVYFRESGSDDALLMNAMVSTYALHLILFFVAVRGKFDIKLAYLSAIIYDILLVPLLVLLTGGTNSAFYPLFFITVSVATYVLTFWFSLSACILVTAGYLFTAFAGFSFDSLFAVILHTGFIWIFYLAILYASDYMRRSEGRLLKLFNTLNMRTAELEKSQAHLEMIYENARILASILDTDGVVKEVMRIMGTVLQYRSYALIAIDRQGHMYYRARCEDGQTTFHPKAIDPSKFSLIERIVKAGESITVRETLKRDDYVPISELSHSAIVVPTVAHGNVNGLLLAESNKPDFFGEKDQQMLSLVARSASLALENAELHKRTEELTIIDELTETYNYRYFVRKLQEEKRRASRYDLPLSLIMVDIDWFKKLNDSYGHEVGNIILKHLSAIIKQCIRDVDIFARYGGEEFAIILPQTPQREAKIIGERIREQVEKEIFDARSLGKVKITVSVGVSSYPENGRSQEELVSITDQALYRAKGEGRNLVCVI